MQTAYMSLGEACERLRIPPRTFRQIMADFGDLLEAPRPSADGKLQELSVETVDTLQDILELRNRGVSVEAIRAELETGALQAGATAEPGDAAERPVAVAEAVGAHAEVAAAAPMHSVSARPATSRPPRPATARPVPPRPGLAWSSAAPAADGDLLAQQAELLTKLEELTTKLSQSEKKSVEDRDRLLTFLMRTQIEIQQLRHALAATASRRDRKQQSWVARWFA